MCFASSSSAAFNAAKAGDELGAGHGADEKAQFDTLTRGEMLDGDDDGPPMEDFDIDFEPVRVTLASDAPAGDAFDALRDREVAVLGAGDALHGVALGLAEDGGLRVRMPNDDVRTVHAGEVSVRTA